MELGRAGSGVAPALGSPVSDLPNTDETIHGRTYNFHFDGIGALIGHEHAQAVVERLIPRSKVWEDEGDIHGLVLCVDDKVVRGQGPRSSISDSMRAVRELQQAVRARRGRGGVLIKLILLIGVR